MIIILHLFPFFPVSWSCCWRDKKGIIHLTGKCFEYRIGKDRNHSCSKRGCVTVLLCVSTDHPVSCEWLRKRMAYSLSDSSFGTHESSPHQGDKITSLINQPHVSFCILDSLWESLAISDRKTLWILLNSPRAIVPGVTGCSLISPAVRNFFHSSSAQDGTSP